MEAFCASLTFPPQYCIDGTVPTQDNQTSGNSHLAIIITVLLISVGVVIVVVIFVYKKCVKK